MWVRRIEITTWVNHVQDVRGKAVEDRRNSARDDLVGHIWYADED